MNKRLAPGLLMRRARCFACCLACALAAAVSVAGQENSAAAKEPAAAVHVSLALAGDKSIFRTGEPVRLVLSFTAERAGYQLDTTTTKPASPIDDVIISPVSGSNRWLDEYSFAGRYYPDYSSIATLSAKPVRVELTMNDWIRFEHPGRYTVRVKTSRVRRTNSPREFGIAPTLETNEVSFDVKAMSEAEEAAEVRRLATLLDAAKNWQEEAKIAEELSYLTGAPSTREKVRRFLSGAGKSGNYFQNIFFGLYMARDRVLAVQLLESALRDPLIGVSHQLISVLTHLRQMQEREASGAPVSHTALLVSGVGMSKPPSAIEQAYVREVALSLPARTGKSLTTTAMTLLAHMPQDPVLASETRARVREALLKNFDSLHPFDQEYLLRVYWEQLKDSSLLPSLKRLAASRGNNTQNQRATALRRIIELAPEEARAFVVAEIRDPESLTDFDVLGALEDRELPEADADLLEQIKRLAALKQNFDITRLQHKTRLIARYATQSIYGELMALYREWGTKWSADAKGSLLGYFAKQHEAEALPLIEEALAGTSNGQYSMLLGELTRAHYSEAISSLLLRRLEGDSAMVAGTAAYIMSQHGTEADEKAIAARLERWLREWGGRGIELEAEGASDQMAEQRMLQVNLIASLTRAKAWKLPEARAVELEQTCVTKTCRQNFPPRQKN